MSRKITRVRSVIEFYNPVASRNAVKIHAGVK